MIQHVHQDYAMVLLLLVLFLISPINPHFRVHAQVLPVGQEIRKLEKENGGHPGLMAKNLKTGELIADNASEKFSTAGVIELPVMAAFLRLAERQLVDRSTRITVESDDTESGPGTLTSLPDGVTISLLDGMGAKSLTCSSSMRCMESMMYFADGWKGGLGELCNMDGLPQNGSWKIPAPDTESMQKPVTDSEGKYRSLGSSRRVFREVDSSTRGHLMKTPEHPTVEQIS